MSGGNLFLDLRLCEMNKMGHSEWNEAECGISKVGELTDPEIAKGRRRVTAFAVLTQSVRLGTRLPFAHLQERD